MSVDLAKAQIVASGLEALLGRVDFARIQPEHEADIRRFVAETLAEHLTPAMVRQLGGAEALEQFHVEVASDLVGARGLFALLQVDGVSDVLVNGPFQVYVERGGVLSLCELRLPSEACLRRIASWFTARVGRPLSDTSPMVDARLPDGSRINVVIPPLALDGTVLSIRRFRHTGLDLDGLARAGAIPHSVLPLLRAMVAARLNLLVSGGTGAGKTTILNALSESIGTHERVVTIEDAAELRLRQRHVVRLETRLADVSGKGEVTTRSLVRNALRMRPDRILVGEVRGAEAIDMLQAMNTGHEGSMGTVHANAPRDALDRLEVMVSMGENQLPDRLVRSQIARSIDAVVHVRRLPDGRRAMTHLSEVGQLQGDVIAMQDIVRLQVQGEGPGGRLSGQFQATGIRPTFMDRLERLGYQIPAETWRSQQVIG